MCITFIKTAKSKNDKFKLILLNNRDENILRPTLEMHWHDGILSGVDTQDVARGTWLGINESGSIGNLLSITQPQDSKNPKAPSRGGIVNDFLKSKDRFEMMNSLKQKAENYNGFQFVALERNQIGLYDVKTLTNMEVDEIKISHWNDEYHVISNSPLCKPYQKVIHGKRLLTEHLQNSNEMETEQIFEKLLNISKDRTACFPDPQLQSQTQLPDEYNRVLSSIFIHAPTRQYGTRCHTLLTIDQNDTVNVLEKRLIPEDSTWLDARFQFDLLLPQSQ